MRDVSRLIKKSWGSAINNLLLSDMRKEIVPLPPWIEQDKIVLIVGNILKKVDQLEQQISRRKEYTNELIKSILKNRGIEEKDYEDFLNPSIRKYMPDPLILKDMDKAVKVIADAILKNKKICIYGDYDVDGITSTAIFVKYLILFL